MSQDHLLILGAGISGLVTAKALCPYFKKITLLDKDQIGGENIRPGASQGAHLHVLLKEGQDILFNYFPQLKQKLLNRDCPLVDWAKDTTWDNPHGRFPIYRSHIKTISMSRRLLESLIFKEVQTLKNVEFVQDTIKEHKDKKIVTKNQTLEADLIVVTLGSSNILKSNLQLKKNIEINLSYRSIVFNSHELNLNKNAQYYYQTSPGSDFPGGVICPIEDGKSIATIIEYNKKLGPHHKDFSHFIKKSKEIPKGYFHEIIKDAEPLSSVSSYYKKNMTLYSPLHMTSNMIYLGDSLSCLNPAFGQGMSVALQEIVYLEKLFKEQNFSPSIFSKKCSNIIRKPFFLAELGSKPSGFLKTLLDTYLFLAMKSKFLHLFFLKQLHLLSKKATYHD